MLQAFIDDSREDPVFLLAGYIAPAERWALFSDRWQEVLDMTPKIAGSFKMKEFFRGGLTAQKIERLNLLHGVIEEHASAVVAIAFDPNKLRIAFAPVAKELGKQNQNPHLFAYTRLMVSVAQAQSQLGLEGPIKFIFDEQMHERRHMLEAWEWAWQYAKPVIPGLKNIIGATPGFETDENARPLQAADMFAWWLRRRFVAQSRGQEPIIPPWADADRPSNVKGFLIQFNGDELKAEADKVLARNEVFKKNGR